MKKKLHKYLIFVSAVIYFLTTIVTVSLLVKYNLSDQRQILESYPTTIILINTILMGVVITLNVSGLLLLNAQIEDIPKPRTDVILALSVILVTVVTFIIEILFL